VKNRLASDSDPESIESTTTSSHAKGGSVAEFKAGGLEDRDGDNIETGVDHRKYPRYAEVNTKGPGTSGIQVRRALIFRLHRCDS
jgi:hypothetical protein